MFLVLGVTNASINNFYTPGIFCTPHFGDFIKRHCLISYGYSYVTISLWLSLALVNHKSSHEFRVNELSSQKYAWT